MGQMYEHTVTVKFSSHDSKEWEMDQSCFDDLKQRFNLANGNQLNWWVKTEYVSVEPILEPPREGEVWITDRGYTRTVLGYLPASDIVVWKGRDSDAYFADKLSIFHRGVKRVS